jgi:hypothetical protein
LFPKKTLIFGEVDKVYKNDVYNAILLNIKYNIYTNRCLKKKLSFHSLKACLINLYKTEKMIAVRNQRIAEFQLLRLSTSRGQNFYSRQPKFRLVRIRLNRSEIIYIYTQRSSGLR